ncbi:MAG: hypothetical protein J7M26_01590 [Armatimonadetes bacterium]|nr:hypothetical protein [Armatimonadota bacterium]
MELQQAPRDRRQGERAGLLANFLMMAGSGYFELFAGLIRSVLVMRLLGPTGNGLVGVVRLAQQYLSNSHLGALHGITKHLPRALGAGDHARAEQIEDVGATWVLLTSSMGAAGILLVSLWASHLGLPTRQVLALGSVVFLCGQVYTLYRTVARAWQVFRPLLLASVAYSVSLTVLMIGGAWAGWATGAVAGWLGASVLAIVVLHYTMRLRIRLSLAWPVVRSLIAAGIPLAAMAFADTLLVALDGTLLVRRGATTFGLYAGIAMQTRRYLFNLARSLTFVLMPHVLEEFAHHKDLVRLRGTALRAATAAACTVPALSLLTALLLPPAAQTLVPKFVTAVPAGQIVAFGTALMILPLAFSTVLVALDAEWPSVAAQLAGAAVIAVAAWQPAGRGDMVGVALASAMGSWVVAMAVGWLALSLTGLRTLQTLRTLAGLQLPLAGAVVTFWLANFAGDELQMHAYTWSGGLLRLAVAAALAAPGLAWAEHRYRLVRRSLQALVQMSRGGAGAVEDDADAQD